MNAKPKDTTSTWIDPDDAPELTDEQFAEADHYRGERLIRRGRGRPRKAEPKVSVTARYDKDVVEAFRETGPGWQTRMNQALKQYMREHDRRELG